MKAVKRILVVAAFAAAIPAPLLAQTADVKEGDFYAPGQTVVQKATPQELKSVEDGDYYASSKTVVEQPTRQEQYQAREGDYYAPDSGK